MSEWKISDDRGDMSEDDEIQAENDIFDRNIQQFH